MKKVALGLVVFLFCISSTVYAAVDLTGTWEGSYSITETRLETGEKSTDTGTVTFELEQKGKRVSGTLSHSSDKTGDTGSGSIKGKITGNIFKFSFKESDTTCPISGKGTAKISGSGDSMDVTITGKDCKRKFKVKGTLSRSSA